MGIKEQAPLIQLNDSILSELNVQLFICQLYLTHPTINGNKWFKLKYNLQEAARLGHHTILTFGGAFSNHIYATAAACKEFGFNSIGIIRGERTPELNSTLKFAESSGMHLHFTDRANYKTKHTESFLVRLKQQFGEFYLIPEGGANVLGVKGCREILRNVIQGGQDPESSDNVSCPLDFDYVCCPCGTGTTLAGISLALKSHQKAMGFSVLKGGEFLKEDTDQFRKAYSHLFAPVNSSPDNVSPASIRDFHINADYHFGGYAKTNTILMKFIETFENQHFIPLDPIYTAKMMFGIYDLIGKGFFSSGSKIIAIHTGGLTSYC